jgi:hypothetical protein
MSRSRYDPSRDRQLLNQLVLEIGQILNAFCEPAALLRGRISRLRRLCGKANCRCRRGHLHENTVFIEQQAGVRKVRNLNYGQYHELTKPAKRYQALKRLRSRLVKLNAQLLACCDRLCEGRIASGKKLLGKVFME